MYFISTIGEGASCLTPPEIPNGKWKCTKDLETCNLLCNNGYGSSQQVTARFFIQIFFLTDIIHKSFRCSEGIWITNQIGVGCQNSNCNENKDVSMNSNEEIGKQKILGENAENYGSSQDDAEERNLEENNSDISDTNNIEDKEGSVHDNNNGSGQDEENESNIKEQNSELSDTKKEELKYGSGQHEEVINTKKEEEKNESEIKEDISNTEERESSNEEDVNNIEEEYSELNHKIDEEIGSGQNEDVVNTKNEEEKTDSEINEYISNSKEKEGSNEEDVSNLKEEYNVINEKKDEEIGSGQDEEVVNTKNEEEKSESEINEDISISEERKSSNENIEKEGSNSLDMEQSEFENIGSGKDELVENSKTYQEEEGKEDNVEDEEKKKKLFRELKEESRLEEENISGSGENYDLDIEEVDKEVEKDILKEAKKEEQITEEDIYDNEINDIVQGGIKEDDTIDDEDMLLGILSEDTNSEETKVRKSKKEREGKDNFDKEVIYDDERNESINEEKTESYENLDEDEEWIESNEDPFSEEDLPSSYTQKKQKHESLEIMDEMAQEEIKNIR